MRRVAVAVAIGVAWASGFGLQASGTAHAAGATSELPGRVVGVAFPRVAAGGGREVVVLVGTTGATPAFSLMRIGTAGDAVIVRDDAGTGASSLVAADLDADGADEMVVARGGRLDAFKRGGDGRYEGPGHALAIDAELGTPSLDAELVTARGLVCLAVVGELRCWSRMAPAAIARVPIPVTASRTDEGFVLKTPRVRRAGVRKDGSTLLAVGPEEIGRRLRTVLVDLDSGFAPRRIESWSLLPGNEEVLESDVLLLDDAPVLVVTTRRADKLQITGEKRVRVFALEEDRTRKGAAPFFSGETGMNLWQDATFAVADVDRDGKQDLLAGYWKGLGDAKAAVEVFRGRAGGFEAKSAKTTFHVEKENRAFFSLADHDADGGIDVLVAANRRMRLHRGGRNPSDLVPSKAAAVSGPIPELATSMSAGIALGGGGTEFSSSGGEALHVIDLDGDGRSEVVAIGARSVTILRLK